MLADDDATVRADLLRLLELHHDEVVSEVGLNWSRITFFLQTSAVMSLGSAFSSARSCHVGLAVLAALVAALGVFVVRRGHTHYLRARDALKCVERAILLVGFGAFDAKEFMLGTTGGQRGQKVRPRIVDAVVITLVAMVVANLVSAGLALR